MNLKSNLLIHLAVVLLSLTFADAQDATNRDLVPAALGLRTDKKGNSWNFQQGGTLGRIGSSMMNTGLALYIDNRQFYPQQPLMTKDGKEFILPARSGANLSGLAVTRRVRLDDKQGVVRYLEIFHNPTAQTVSASVELRTNFSGNYQAYVTDAGKSSKTVLGAKETGIVVSPAATNQRHAFVFGLRSPQSQLRPTLASQSRYVVSTHFQIDVPAGETHCFLHTVGQVPVPTNLDRKTLANVFRPVALHRHLASVPKDLRSKIVNFSLAEEAQGIALLSATSIDRLGVRRGRKDILAVGNATRLVGSSSCSKLSIETEFGSAEFAFEEVAAMVGGNRGRRDRSRVFLRDGQVFGGEILAESLRFILHSGNAMDLEVEKLDRLVRAREEPLEAWPEGVVAFLETHGGDRLAIRPSESARLSLVSPWGELEVQLDEVLSISSPESEPVGHLVQLKDGSRFFGFAAGSEFQFETPKFGEQTLRPSEIRAIVSRESANAPENSGIGEWESPRLTDPYLTLRGQQRLVGRVLDPQLTVLTEGEWIQLAPETIRFLTNRSDEFAEIVVREPNYRAELWGGGVVSGELRERVFTIQLSGANWQIPVRDVRQVVVPTPRVTDETRSLIANWIWKLGNDDWLVRERATEELAEFGFLAKPQLLEATNLSSDPEVLRRVEWLIQRLD